MSDTFLGRVKKIATPSSSGMEVSMDDAVNVVINKYEESLMERRSSILDRQVDVAEELASLNEELIASVDKSQYETGLPTIGVSVKITSVTPIWITDPEDETKSHLRLTAMLTDEDETNPHTATFGKYIKSEISDFDINVHNANKERFDSIQIELDDVCELLDNVGRKERQVRARISEIRLREAGYSKLIEDEQINALIALD